MELHLLVTLVVYESEFSILDLEPKASKQRCITTHARDCLRSALVKDAPPRISLLANANTVRAQRKAIGEPRRAVLKSGDRVAAGTARLIHGGKRNGDRAVAEDSGQPDTSRSAMKGEHLFASGAPFFQRVYLLGGEELVVLQSTVGETSLGDSFHQITDFNDLPTSLFACNVDQSVFEEQEGKCLNQRFSGSSHDLQAGYQNRDTVLPFACYRLPTVVAKPGELPHRSSVGQSGL
ncbi:hypothetical protein SRHO_G00072040 [Serrasalmus rhombeus]